MTDACTRCGAPLIWSDTHRRMWCAIYGTHTATPARIVIGYHPVITTILSTTHRRRHTMTTAEPARTP